MSTIIFLTNKLFIDIYKLHYIDKIIKWKFFFYFIKVVWENYENYYNIFIFLNTLIGYQHIHSLLDKINCQIYTII